jgi:hypothetical protein
MAVEKKTKPEKAEKKPQSERFKETARKLDCDESGKQFAEAIKKVIFVKQKGK